MSKHPWSKQHRDHKPAFLRPLADVLWPGVARRSEPDFKAVRNRGHGSLGISSLTVQAHACLWLQQTSKEVKSLAIPACTWFLRDFGKMNVVAILPSLTICALSLLNVLVEVELLLELQFTSLDTTASLPFIWTQNCQDKTHQNSFDSVLTHLTTGTILLSL